MFYVYILRSEVDGCLYKGMTNNLQKRIEEHNSGKNKSTKGFLPWILVYNEEFETRIEARAREKYFKSVVGREYLKSILDN
ncbi:GIY-YIG nuclease family protein [Maribacter sp. M208]|uniref:GIY-YIG nuclease family protein n=1 Tax=Maribacter huludaoensis TaxID=3030010 RepID=UPI0023ED9FC4|nr:GIY-YIG nuclease family protein [Maribacter huludaoensis]MDF4223395.1 GIY-YIG nuclease family protein [Maribacter huludaoensis]